MPPPGFVQLEKLDFDQILFSRDRIQDMLPQRHEFAQLDAVLAMDTVARTIVGYRDIRPDEWWCRGHLPQKAIFPGVLMLEAAAQLSAVFRSVVMPADGFLGFGGVDGAKFRGAVYPPARLVLTGRAIDERRRRFICGTQGFVDGVLVFEATITGMPMEL